MATMPGRTRPAGCAVLPSECQQPREGGCQGAAPESPGARYSAVPPLGLPGATPSAACALDAYVWLANRLPRVRRRTGAKVEQVDGGLLLKPSPPPIRRKVHVVTKG